MTNQSTSAAAAVAPGTRWVQATSFANLLLRRGRRVLHVTDSLSSGLERGAFVVPLSPAHDPGLTAPVDAEEVRFAAAASGVDLVWLNGYERFIGEPLSSARVGLYGGGGAPFNQASILAECGFPIAFLSDAE